VCANNDTPGHIDLHVACEKDWLGRRRWVHFYYTVYYAIH